MSAHDPDQPGLRPPSVPAGGAARGRRAAFEAALRKLAEALATRRVEPVCTAYLELRQAGRGMPPERILQAAGEVDGRAGRDLIVSAFSRRRCLMCDDGTLACKTCNGGGVVNDYPCPSCDGQGVEVCSFCMGVGWSDEDEIPTELRDQVRRRRTRSLGHDAEKLNRLSLTRALASARGADASQRRELMPWLLRLQARLAVADDGQDGNGEAFAATRRTLSDRIEKLLQALRPSRPAPPPKDKP